MNTAEFLMGVLDLARQQVPTDLRDFTARQQWSLAKAYFEDPAMHFEICLHRARARVELGLHFETRDAERNYRLLEWLTDELLFFKTALGESFEAEPWDKGWTRLYLTLPLEPLTLDFQARLAEQFATLVETLEPARRDAVEALQSKP